MRHARLFLATACLLLLGVGVTAVQGSFSTWGLTLRWEIVDRAVLLDRVESLGILAIGWGVGVTGWLITGHQALSCFLGEMPRSWVLWRRDVLTNILPVLKYLIAGVLFVVFGSILVHQLWGLWTGAYDVGLLTGGITGIIHFLSRTWDIHSLIDFLEANQRYVNEEKVSLFTEYDKP
jgi:hypothetical protein